MSMDEIMDLTVPVDDEGHVFLWTTQRYLPNGLEITKHWGLHYLFTMVWHKSDGFQQTGFPRYNCEFVVAARKGKAKFLTTKQFPACFNAPRREHSRKPDEFYDIIRRVCAGPRLDMFSREKREGFFSWGNEVEKFSKQPADATNET